MQNYHNQTDLNFYVKFPMSMFEFDNKISLCFNKLSDITSGSDPDLVTSPFLAATLVPKGRPFCVLNPTAAGFVTHRSLAPTHQFPPQLRCTWEKILDEKPVLVQLLAGDEVHAWLFEPKGIVLKLKNY